MQRIFFASVLPAIMIAVTAYFGYYAVCGPRGMIALNDTRAKLGVEQGTLAALQANRQHLQHRIDLLAFGRADPDLVTELARSQMLASTPGQVAIPRDKQ